MKKKTVILFTGSFPYTEAKESVFIIPELPILSEKFEKVIIVPLSAKESLISLDVYKNVQIDIDLFHHYFQANLFKKILLVLTSLFSVEFVRAIFCDKTIFSFRKNRLILSEYYRACCVNKWLQYFFKSVGKDDEYILYTYWFNYATLGIALFEHPSVKARVTRCHRFDLYDSRVYFRSTYFRKLTLKKITNVYSVSMEGKKYLQNKFSEYCDKIDCIYLGIIEPIRRNIIHHNEANSLCVFSCSYMVLVKRNTLLAYYIIALADKFPNCMISWTHAGGGTLLEDVKKIVKDNVRNNLSVVFLGDVDNSEIMEYYSNSSVDVFVSLTESEGLPVSMMEAQSYGIPIVSTNVGGISEIVIDSKTGFLLNADPTLEEFIDKMIFFMKHDSNEQKMRNDSYQNWLDNFDAKTNHLKFVEQISNCTFNLIANK